MAAVLTDIVEVKMLFDVPAPRTVWATDDTSEGERFITQNDPPLDLMQEIFARLLAYQQLQKPLQLMIDSGRYIVRDPNFPLPPTFTAAAPTGGAPTKTGATMPQNVTQAPPATKKTTPKSAKKGRGNA
jgi:hypothetical protein